MQSKFKILISSDIEYEDLCAEIFFEEEFIAIITQEKGFENLEIDIYPKKSGKSWHFSYYDFEKVLQEAKQILWKMQKLPEDGQSEKM